VKKENARLQPGASRNKDAESLALVFDRVPDPLLLDASGEPARFAKVSYVRAGQPFHAFVIDPRKQDKDEQDSRILLEFQAVSWPGTRFAKEPRPLLPLFYRLGCLCEEPRRGRPCRRARFPGPRSRLMRDVQVALNGPPPKGERVDFDAIFKGKVFLAALFTVEKDESGNEFHPAQRYSRLERLLAFAGGHDWTDNEELPPHPLTRTNRPTRTSTGTRTGTGTGTGFRAMSRGVAGRERFR
jgi:hypothetical protein